MRVGVYVDGFNLYYGARGLCGRSTTGWRWLDLRALAADLVRTHSGWEAPSAMRVVYCTARIGGRGNAGGAHDQDTYLRALQAANSIDALALGTYVARVATAPLATPDRHGRPILTHPRWPLMVRSGEDADEPDATFMASVARREEKGSDVNVASHLLLDTLVGKIDAAVVISNDSDLELPIREVRSRLPVGTVNPTKGFPAGRLNGAPEEGAGGHWWHQLSAPELMAAQLPHQVGRLHRPVGW